MPWMRDMKGLCHHDAGGADVPLCGQSDSEHVHIVPLRNRHQSGVVAPNRRAEIGMRLWAWLEGLPFDVVVREWRWTINGAADPRFR